ncbi:MAG TPA: hypothetical protein VK484_11150 [Ferruginibacter sp.]|nr:hypothetical protein [Ferruginibacter sp.]
MNLRIPINNTVEIIVADLYVNIQCKLQPQIPVEKTEAKLALQQIEMKINQIFSEAVYKAKKELEKELQDN